LIFVRSARNYQYHSSATLFELKQALDCFEHCKLLGGQLVYYRKVLQEPYC
jgi:hypothetical protein